MNDEELYMKCVDDFYANMLKYVTRRVHNQEDANDILQDTYEVVWKNRIKLKMMDHPEKYIYSILNHKLCHHVQKKVNSEFPTADIAENLIDIERDVINTIIHDEYYHEIREAMNKLGGDYMRILNLCFVDDRAVTEVARILNLNYNTALWRKHHAIRELRLLLIERGLKPSVRRKSTNGPKSFFSRLYFIMVKLWMKWTKRDRSWKLV